MSLRRAAVLRWILPATVAGLLLGVASEAVADGYIGGGLGSGSELSGEISNHFSTDEDTASSRVMVGERFGALAVEGSVFGSELRGASGLSGGGDYSTISLGIDLKYYVGLVGGLEGYGKIGLNRTWLSTRDTSSEMDYHGRGKQLGLGLQYNFNLPVTRLGLWLDYTAQEADLRNDQDQVIDGSIEMVNLGVSVGF